MCLLGLQIGNRCPGSSFILSLACASVYICLSHTTSRYHTTVVLECILQIFTSFLSALYKAPSYKAYISHSFERTHFPNTGSHPHTSYRPTGGSFLISSHSKIPMPLWPPLCLERAKETLDFVSSNTIWERERERLVWYLFVLKSAMIQWSKLFYTPRCPSCRSCG